jgi:hypothetical protein
MTVGTVGVANNNGMAALELEVRAAIVQLGARLLEAPRGLDGRQRSARVDCCAGDGARLRRLSRKAPRNRGRSGHSPPSLLPLRRIWRRVVPKNDETGVTGASMPPELRAIVDIDTD